MLTLEGKIEDFSIGEIIQVIAMGRKTGTLVIDGAREQISIYFKDGKAVYANPVYQREHLGNILVKHGVITRDDVNDALDLQKELNDRGERVRIGPILVSMGVLTNEVLSKYVTAQIKESIYTIMAEKSGSFKFSSDIDMSSRDIVIELDVEETILEGTRLIDAWAIIKDKLVDFDDVYAINANPADVGSIQLTIDEWKILTLLDGQRSINDVIEIAKLSRFEVCKTIYNFVQLKLVKKLDRESINGVPIETKRISNPKPKRGIVRRLMDRIRRI
ncbi:MAG: DUF4388 domain-containing protein [Candidatus Coatesbacteria bacterium]|nr:MAG: DUF4388 domain-containing protein [Candidatus Coatesbacteria bacterium]